MIGGLGVAVGVGDGSPAHRFRAAEAIQRTLKPIMKRELQRSSTLDDFEKTGITRHVTVRSSPFEWWQELSRFQCLCQPTVVGNRREAG